MAADPVALERLYRTGAIDSANNLDKVAMIDLRGPDPGAFHDVFRTYAMRARLQGTSEQPRTRSSGAARCR